MVKYRLILSMSYCPYRNIKQAVISSVPYNCTDQIYKIYKAGVILLWSPEGLFRNAIYPAVLKNKNTTTEIPPPLLLLPPRKMHSWGREGL